MFNFQCTPISIKHNSNVRSNTTKRIRILGNRHNINELIDRSGYDNSLNAKIGCFLV